MLSLNISLHLGEIISSNMDRYTCDGVRNLPIIFLVFRISENSSRYLGIQPRYLRIWLSLSMLYAFCAARDHLSSGLIFPVKTLHAVLNKRKVTRTFNGTFRRNNSSTGLSIASCIASLYGGMEAASKECS